MDSLDAIRKFDDIVQLRCCILYHPVMNVRDYAAMKYLDSNAYTSKSALVRIHFYLNTDKRRN